MNMRSVCLLAFVAVCSSAVPLYQAPAIHGLHYEGKKDLHDLPQAKDLHQPIKPLSYPSYPFFYPYHAPYYFPNLYHPFNYYNNKAVLSKDAKQAPVPLKAPVYGFKAPVYDFKAPVYDFKTTKDSKVPHYPFPQYVYAPFPVKQEKLEPVHQHAEPAPVAPEPVAPVHEEEYKPVIHQEYKEVEMFPEVQEVAHEEQEEKQIVHKDEPAFRSFIFIGKYSGSCQGEKDGLYYVDKKTFAYCVDQRDVFQPCPEGTENPDAEEFMKGKLQYSHHFCSVNLLAQNPEPVPTHADPHYNTYQYEEVPEEKY